MVKKSGNGGACVSLFRRKSQDNKQRGILNKEATQ